MKKADKDYFFKTLEKKYPNADTELHRGTAYQLLIAVIMSAQTTDKQVNKVTKTLFKKTKHPQDIVDMGLDNLTKTIQSIGLYKTKAKNIYLTSQQLLQPQKQKIRHKSNQLLYKQKGYYIPESIENLKKLPGVGEKTAKVVGHTLFERPVIAVDTHVHRVSNRIGLVNTSKPQDTNKIIEKKIPKQYRQIAHHSLILFGRYHCKAKKPLCETCPFTHFCTRYQKTIFNTKTCPGKNHNEE